MNINYFNAVFQNRVWFRSLWIKDIAGNWKTVYGPPRAPVGPLFLRRYYWLGFAVTLSLFAPVSSPKPAPEGIEPTGKSGHWMSALPPKADVFEEVRESRLLTQLRHYRPDHFRGQNPGNVNGATMM